MSITYTAFISKILTDMKAYLVTEYPATVRRTFFGRITEGEFLSSAKPAMSIIFESGRGNERAHEWEFDIAVLLLEYDPKKTTDYDIIVDGEELMTKLSAHLEAQEAAGLAFGGLVVGGEMDAIDHEDSYIYAFRVSMKIKRLEI